MADIDDLTEQLRTLFGDSPESNPLFKEMVKQLTDAEKVESKKAFAKRQPPVTVYTEVTRIHHCTHCDATWTTTVRLQKGETLANMGIDGHVTTISAKSPAVVHHYVGFCNRCPDHIHSLSREELEDKYLSLLASYPFAQVHGLANYVQKLNTVDEADRKEVKL